MWCFNKLPSAIEKLHETLIVAHDTVFINPYLV